MFEKISRSWSLAGQCWDVLKEDPALLLFPLMSSIAMLVILGSFALPVFALYHSVDPHTIRDTATHTGRAMFYLGTYIFYVVSYTVMMFFNSALISVALKRLTVNPPRWETVSAKGIDGVRIEEEWLGDRKLSVQGPDGYLCIYQESTTYT